ncbi:Nif3-like dinuclear metal center hexameric protein [Laribacter hongkongensis]|uniref:Nif3-like dinuclear metal center hexameric protein n=1 Tax=Laribacter hongkongensis TaxID=168471 RepID=A0ABD4SU84_9NEIS|nr:Nif3-like dinuclear metal center hexameric protein [Laribacter hongkongensis]MCG9026798.1 Nif3-like dinuclear metal center hexameric protein [Laribacter hongkongensis]MCG9053755.1 Nif3-like dinuclear metal center hexameric protein [Laribacter hongkongensis]MCG9090059.1 Nif3-like dinuclear metal center hexameric protein [Laribacter hongkongensis]MCG9101094.1 Nif3-like dinuclear metal center hexameric protein [Laribacter hongkongensis]MCG9104299.1 Nif3-like dinuclear metal center hexameric pr
MDVIELVSRLDTLLEPWKFKDYCPNGLQVEGARRIERVVCGVTASQALLDEAVRLDADAVLVHHGYFWKGEPAAVTGIKRKRLATLLANNLHLLAYHLPLDAHPQFGNNAGLAQALGLQMQGTAGEQGLLAWGVPENSCNVGELALRTSGALERLPLVIGSLERPVRRVAWCTGGGQGMFADAVDLGVDAFITGEASEYCCHLARESGVAFLAAGHHATERFGVQSLTRWLREQGLDARYVEIDNPI